MYLNHYCQRAISFRLGVSRAISSYFNMSSPKVTVAEGILQGSTRVTPNGFQFNTFLGIPFAKAPIGNLRFQDPQPPEKWSGTRDATVQGEINSQFDPLLNSYVGSEDSLFLNVSVPSTASPKSNLPVMCYIHGGAFYMGNGTFERYRPDFLVQKDIIVVTFNYRVGILGFLCLHTPEVPGNAGMKDQVFALRWIQKNIKSFGGDPQNVTLVGESAGAACVHYHMMSPMSKGLFKRAIIQSGSCLSEWSKQKDPLTNAFQAAEMLGMKKTTDKDELLHFLRNLPIDKLVTASIHGPSYVLSIKFCVVVEHKFSNCEPFLIESPEELMKTGNYNIVPCIIGTTSHEGLVFLFPHMMKAFEKDEFELTIDELQFMMKKFTKCDMEREDLITVHDYFMTQTNPLLGFIDFLTELYFKRDILKTVEIMRMHCDKVFHYLYAYYGELNKLQQTPLCPYNGAGHADENRYLFKKENDDVLLNPSDELNRERLTQMWTNFIKFENPTPLKNDVITELWTPNTKEELHCLEINQNLKMTIDSEPENLSFMESMISMYKT